MRNINRILLLSAGILALGCQKGIETEKVGNEVRFGASSGAVLTRTSYGSDVKEGNTLYQMIDWSEDDQVLIWSDNAINRAGQEGRSAVYNLQGIGTSGHESTASLNRAGEDGLVFQDADNLSYTFWGMYPADAYTTESVPTDGEVLYSIPATQVRFGQPVTTDGNIVENPDMDKAVLFAKSKAVAKNEKVSLKFYPAFTAFEFELKNNTTGAIVLNDVTLSSGTGDNASILAGDVVATLATADGAATLAMKQEGASSKTVKYSFGDGSGVTVAVGKSLKFTVFTTGVGDLTGLSADFTYGNGVVRHATFKKNGQPITFNACKKYRLLGIMLQEEWYFAEINLEGEPLWLDKTANTDNKNYPEATQFDVTGVVANGRYSNQTGVATTYVQKTENGQPVYDDDGNPVMVARKNNAYRQYWLMSTTETATISFKVMSPVGYYWLVVPQGDVEKYVITGNGTAEGGGGLKGLINDKKTVTINGQSVEVAATTNVVITVKAKSASDTNEYKLWFKTYAVSADGKIQYSLDSETQLYDLVTDPTTGPRGYHYFVLNNSTIVK